MARRSLRLDSGSVERGHGLRRTPVDVRRRPAPAAAPASGHGASACAASGFRLDRGRARMARRTVHLKPRVAGNPNDGAITGGPATGIATAAGRRGIPAAGSTATMAITTTAITIGDHGDHDTATVQRPRPRLRSPRSRPRPRLRSPRYAAITTMAITTMVSTATTTTAIGTASNAPLSTPGLCWCRWSKEPLGETCQKEAGPPPWSTRSPHSILPVRGPTCCCLAADFESDSVRSASK